MSTLNVGDHVTFIGLDFVEHEGYVAAVFTVPNEDQTPSLIWGFLVQKTESTDYLWGYQSQVISVNGMDL